MTELDDGSLRKRLDPDGSYERNRDFPQQCRDAWAAARDLQLPDAYRSPARIVIAGMGGSAIAGDYFSALAYEHGVRPVTVLRGYSLPGWVGAGDLVICCSHSGNTEETLSSFNHARSNNAQVIAVTTGGQLKRDALAASIPLLSYEFDGEPRAAFGHMLMRLLGIERAVNDTAPPDDSIASALDELDAMQPQLAEDFLEVDNPAKQLARRLHENLPLFVGGAFLVPAAKRWKTQVSENADQYAMAEELPEMHHNTVVGLQLPREIASRVHAVLLEHAGLSSRMQARVKVTSELFNRAGLSHERRDVGGSSPLAGVLRDAYMQNMTTYYLGLLNNVRPFSVDNIDWLKNRLSQM